MKFQTSELLQELSQQVQSHLDFALSLESELEAILNLKNEPNSWSALECLEHLNLYGHFYIPEIQKRMDASSLPASDIFHCGVLGNKFANDMLPKEKMRKMSTFKSKNPINSRLDTPEVLQTFISHQQALLRLLQTAQTKNLTKIKTSITLPLLKFRLGDTFRFVIYHNERHVVQAKNILNNLK